MDFNQHKVKGDAFIKEKRYQDALDCYTAALASDPSSHTVLSNRSLAFFKLGKFQEALDDSNKCIAIAPGFGRGYLRKATALNCRSIYTEAMHAAAEGYKCRQSDLVCKECISQWLLANQALHRELVNQASKSFGIPTGVSILSEKVCTILHKTSITRVSGAGMTHTLMTRFLLDVMEEIEFFLNKFGHTNPPSMSDWIRSLSLTVAVDPQTDSIRKEAVSQIVQKGNEFSRNLMVNVDPVLHPILCPLVVLCVIIINGRSYTLSCTNSGHQERRVISESLLPLFRSGILNSEPYTVHHLCTLVGLLGSFHGHRTPLTIANIQQANAYSQQMRMLLTKLTPKVWEYCELKEICFNTLAITEKETEIMRQRHGDLYVTAGIEEAVREKFRSDIPPMVVSSVGQYMEGVKKKRPELLTVDDAEYLLYGSCKQGICKLLFSPNNVTDVTSLPLSSDIMCTSI